MNAVIKAVEQAGGEFIHWSENKTCEYDLERALPPMSFRITVKGGKKKDIARAIWDNKFLGVLSVGNTSLNVTDCCGGYKHKIKFERI